MKRLCLGRRGRGGQGGYGGGLGGENGDDDADEHHGGARVEPDGGALGEEEPAGDRDDQELDGDGECDGVGLGAAEQVHGGGVAADGGEQDDAGDGEPCRRGGGKYSLAEHGRDKLQGGGGEVKWDAEEDNVLAGAEF